MLQDCVRLARHASGAELPVSHSSAPLGCPLPSPSNGLEYYFYYYSSLLSLVLVGFLFPSSFFDSLAVSLLAKTSSAQGRELRRAQARADGGACQPQPSKPPTAAVEKHVGCGLLFSTHSITETPSRRFASSLKAAITKQVFSI